MTIAGYNTHITTMRFPDQTGSETFALFKAPSVGATILSAYIVPTATFDADGSNYYSVALQDGGAAGTGTTAMGSVGGASVDFTADTAAALTMTSDSVDGGDWVRVAYAETGTVAPGDITIWVEWTAGGT